MKKFAFILALAVLAATPSLADNMPVNADGLTWGPAPPVLPKGAQIAVLSGDPSKDGLYVLRLKMPANYKIPRLRKVGPERILALMEGEH